MRFCQLLSCGSVVVAAACLVGADTAPSSELQTVCAAVKTALKQLDPPAQFDYPDAQESLVITYLPQTFKVHSVSMTGEVSAEAHDEQGPSFKGFVLRVYTQAKGEVNQAVTPQTIHRPYWLTDLNVTPLGKSDKQIYWALSYGGRTDKKLLDDLRAKLKGLK